jgi:hypothetical protein
MKHTNESEPYIIYDERLELYLVLINKDGKEVQIAHVLTKEEAELFLSE